MSDNEAIFAIMTMAIISATLITLFRIWVHRGRSAPPPTQLEPLNDRLLRIEQTLDSVAIEVERISEAQRFATKLLADEKVPALAQGRGASEAR